MALEEVERLPSTNLTWLYRSEGKVLPEHLGGGCILLAVRLRRLLHLYRPDAVRCWPAEP